MSKPVLCSSFYGRCELCYPVKIDNFRLELALKGHTALGSKEKSGHCHVALKLATKIAVMLGQGLYPKTYDPQADLIDADDITATLDRMKSVIRNGVATLPGHYEFIKGLKPSA